MVFSDQAFLFIFLPVALCAGLLASGTRFFAPVILLASLLFFYWSSGGYVVLLLASIALNYAGGLAIERWRSKATVAAVVSANVLILFYYKYAYFVLSNAGFAGSRTLQTIAESIVLPIGISFFTFQGISYVVDVWRGDIRAERSLLVFAAYKAFFPQLIAGPIVRYADVHDDFHTPKRSTQMFADGVVRFMVGLCKKVLVADAVAGVADACFSLSGDELTFAGAWIGTIAYSIQIYFDFSGYSDMAIGLAMMFGIRFRENFNHPYAASTITDFWRRWHISLSTWFRDYVYVPLGGSRRGPWRTYSNLMLVFLITGIWHGAEWTFLFWGIYHGIFLMAERLILRDRLTTSPLLRVFYFFPVVLTGWALFRAPTLAAFGDHLSAMFAPFTQGAWTLPPSMIVALMPTSIAVLLLSSLAVLMQDRYRPTGVGLAGANTPLARWGRVPFVAAAGIACALYIMPQSFSPFLYFRF